MKLETLDEVVVGAIIAEARDIANKRVRLLERLKEALQRGEVEAALRCARQLCGLSEDGNEGNLSVSGEHPGAGSG